jgi:nucleotide-binding universal stress UspA family protein
VVSADARTGASVDSRGRKEIEMSTILVATDGSEEGRAALEAAVELAADEHALLVCVHVVSILDFTGHADGTQSVPPGRVPRAEDDPVLCEALEVATSAGVTARAELLVGYPPNQIVRLADEIGADLIVVGSRGLGRVKSVVIGSTSRAVLAHAHRPVLAVRGAPAGKQATA